MSDRNTGVKLKWNPDINKSVSERGANMYIFLICCYAFVPVLTCIILPNFKKKAGIFVSPYAMIKPKYVI